VCYRMCPIGEWMMCPACYCSMPTLIGDGEHWRKDVVKDEADSARASSGSTVVQKSARVKRIMKKPAAK
jgi:hypothetical protein